MSATKRHLIGLACLGVLVLFANLGGPRLWDRDEPRNAGCAVEMLQRGDWVVPVFNGELRTHKPVLTYWLIMLAYTVFGVSEFSARFGSALLAVGTALMTYGIGRRLFSPAVGLWAAVILMTTVMFDVAARAATPDSPLLFFCTLATLLFVWGTFPDRSPHAEGPVGAAPVRDFPRLPIAVLMYASMGLATLAKGPVGFVLPTAVIGMYLLILRLPDVEVAESGRFGQRVANLLWRALRPFHPIHFLRTCWVMRPVTAVLVIAAIALPWYWLVGIRTEGQWLEGFFVEHNLGRAARPMEGHHGSLLFYPVALLAGFFPWSIFAVPAGIEIGRRLRRRGASYAGAVLATCWLGVYIGAFSIAQTKLPSYITPAYPGVALLVALFVHAWAAGYSFPSWLWSRLAFGSLALAGLVALIAVPIVASYYAPGDQSLGLIGLVPMVTAWVCYRLMRQAQTARALVLFATSAVVLMLSIFAFAAQRVDRHRSFDHLLASARHHEHRPKIATLEVLQPSWVFYSGQPLDEACREAMEDGVPSLACSRSRRCGQTWVRKPRVPVRQYLAAGPDRFVITTRRVLDQIEPLPPTVQVLAETSGFLKDRELILLGWSTPARHMARQQGPLQR
jgi:4-amino-4-deoxy-L-arabinose transferase-like glycosyltransferase